MCIQSWYKTLEVQLDIIIHNNRFLRAVGLRRIKILLVILFTLGAFIAVASGLSALGFLLTTEYVELNNSKVLLFELRLAKFGISLNAPINASINIPLEAPLKAPLEASMDFDYEEDDDVQDMKAPIAPTDTVSQRAQNVSQNCEKLGLILDPIVDLKEYQLSNIFIDDKNKFIFCSVPGNGATNWRRVILKLTEKTDKTDLFDIPGDKLFEAGIFKQLGKVPNPEREKVIKEYTKVMVIRDPLERLLFIYLSKFKQKLYNEYYRKTFDKPIIKHTRKDVPADKLDKLHNVRFGEFLKFILLVTSLNPDQELAGFRDNELWNSMNDMCHPCAIKYDKIIQFINLTAESDFVLSSIGSNIRFPVEPSQRNTKKELKEYYGRLPKELVKKIMEHYENDLKLFEYI
jgi:hypothetical protein